MHNKQTNKQTNNEQVFSHSYLLLSTSKSLKCIAIFTPISIYYRQNLLFLNRMAMSDIKVYSLLVVAIALTYHNALDCGFVFDDASAIKDNKDLRPDTPFINLFWNDFWGTPMHKVINVKTLFLFAVLHAYLPHLCWYIKFFPCMCCF